MTSKIITALAWIGLAIPCVAQTPPAAPAEGGAALAQQAADPTAPLMAFNFKSEYVPSFYGLSGSGTDFIFQPVIPFRV